MIIIAAISCGLSGQNSYHFMKGLFTNNEFVKSLFLLHNKKLIFCQKPTNCAKTIDIFFF